jgi:hypothetical protein
MQDYLEGCRTYVYIGENRWSHYEGRPGEFFLERQILFSHLHHQFWFFFHSFRTRCAKEGSTVDAVALNSRLGQTLKR